MWATAATAAVAVVTMIVGEIRRRRSHTISETRRVALSEHEALGLEAQLKRLADSFEGIATRHTAHEIECASFRAGIEKEVMLTREWLESNDRRLENLSSQFARLMPAADTFVEIIPNGRRRRDIQPKVPRIRT